MKMALFSLGLSAHIQFQLKFVKQLHDIPHSKTVLFLLTIFRNDTVRSNQIGLQFLGFRF